MIELHALMVTVIDKEEPGSTNYIIADYIMKNVETMDNITTSKMAAACNVSKASISRFCRYIGLEDFFSLKVLIKTYQPGGNVAAKYSFKNKSNKDDITDFLADSTILIQTLERELDRAMLRKIAADIQRYERVYLMGNHQSAGIVLSLQYELLSLNKMTKYVCEPLKQREILEQSTGEDLIIIFSATGAFIDKLLSRKHVMKRASCPRIYMITVSDGVKDPFVYEYVKIADSYNFASNLLLNFYSVLISIEYKNDYFVS